jgi:2-dehydropantoate 2-reductase
MRLAVIGAGAMGGTLAAEAAEAGHTVTVVDVSQEIVERVRREGLLVETPEGELRAEVAATTDTAEVGPVDVVVVFVKAQHTRGAGETASALLGADTVVATLQNGWGNADVLAEVLPPERLVAGVTYNSCTMLEPGRLKHSGRGPTVVGPFSIDGDLGPARRTAELLTTAGWTAEATGAARIEIWKKLVLNAATLPTAALTGLPAGEVGQPGPLLDLVDDLARETVHVAQAMGLDLDPEERVERIHSVLVNAGSGKASMLQDVEARRRTEIETINAAVVRAGQQHGVEVPLNRAMVALVSGLERSWAL